MYYAGQQALDDNCFYTIKDYETPEPEMFGDDDISEMDFEACGFGEQIEIEIENHITNLELMDSIDANNDTNESFFGDRIDGTYDVHFNNDQDSNAKGFELSLQECKDYIAANNGSDESYFADYKGGTVSVVENETGETYFETEIK